MFYDRTDKLLEALDEIVIDRFDALKQRLGVPMDELNRLCDGLYDEMVKIARQSFTELANAVYRDHGKGKPKPRYGAMLVEEILAGYDPVSKYVFTHEMDRRAARLFEALMSSETPTAEVDTAKRAMALAYHIYAVRVTDEAAVRAMKDSGEEKVRWVAEDDSRTCQVCHKRDNRVYDIDAIPPKPHINCRCWLVRVRND